MIVIVGDKVYDSRKTPILLDLADKDCENLVKQTKRKRILFTHPPRMAEKVAHSTLQKMLNKLMWHKYPKRK
jgi:hypothetical protein